MEKEVLIKHKYTNIHAKITSNGKRGGLLMLAHSFKSDLDEDDRFKILAERLSKHDIHCIRMDFPGSEKASQDYLGYSLDSCIEYLETCYRYMLDNYDIDTEHLGLLGYSMGGRIITLFNRKHKEFKTMVYWATCNRKFDINDTFLEQKLDLLKQEADKKGYCNFYDIFENVITKFPKEFIVNLLEYDTLNVLNNYDGNCLIVHGDKDITVDMAESEKLFDYLTNCKNKRLEIIHEADHGFGLWDDRKDLNEKLLRISEDYILKYL